MAQIINLVVTLTLIVMMVSVGLSVTLDAITGVARDWRLLVKAMVANYIAFPAAAVALLILFRASPMASAGLLILAVCPGAPFAPPLTRIAKGNVAVSVGLMVLLAGSSVLLAPALLRVLLPLLSRGAPLHVDAGKIVATLLVTQLVPLGLGLLVGQLRPQLGARLKKPFDRATRLLTAIAIVLVLVTRIHTLAEIRLVGLVGMLTLWALSMLFGWIAGDAREGIRETVAETTALRNVGLAMVIAARSFPNTAVLPAVVAYGAVSILACVIVAFRWGRRPTQGGPIAAGRVPMAT
jgi:BASS family bile acid:Na+ symporter